MTTAPHKHRKSLGQHFLIDPFILNQMHDAISPQADDTIIEIGPGLGALTEYLQPHVSAYHMVEIDDNLVRRLQNTYADNPTVTIHHADALRVNYQQWATHGTSSRIRLAGNLPYQIATELLFQWMSAINVFQDLHIMVQTEVAQRLTAQPNDKLYGRLSILTQYFYDVEWLLDAGPEAFDPPPKVDSAVVALRPKPITSETQPVFHTLNTVLRHAFQHRRKTLLNNLKDLYPRTQLDKVSFDLSQRAQELSVQNFIELSKLLHIHAL